MRKLYFLNCMVIALCIVVTTVLLIFMPDTIAAHYNLAGEADRFGSKFESLLFPLSSVLLGGFFLLLARQQHNNGEVQNEKILLYSGAAILLFNASLGFCFMAKAIAYDPSAAASVRIDSMRLVSIAIGLLLMVLGCVMAKTRRNSLFGLRTKWSMANDVVWQKSQRFCGVASVICGLVTVAFAPFVPGVWNVLLMTAALAAWLAVSVVASYRYHQADKTDPKQPVH